MARKGRAYYRNLIITPIAPTATIIIEPSLIVMRLFLGKLFAQSSKNSANG